ncbi:MAG: hypothetical protein ACI9FJ_001592 [Alteromonadaceae bacterium]|jgi:hypothetical protein
MGGFCQAVEYPLFFRVQILPTFGWIVISPAFGWQERQQRSVPRDEFTNKPQPIDNPCIFKIIFQFMLSAVGAAPKRHSQNRGKRKRS